MEEQKRTFLQRVGDILMNRNVTQMVTPADPKKARDNTLNALDTYLASKYEKETPQAVKDMIKGMENLESYSGVKRINPGDQKDGSNSYGVLHMGQGAVNEFTKAPKRYNYSGPTDIKAEELQSSLRDNIQRYITSQRIMRDMNVNKRDLYSATQFVQNPGAKNYATTSMERFNNPVTPASR